MVWNGRPWHVSGLNLVLRRWEPFFDPYSATIQRIDQWVKITRLPLELWEEETLKQLLQDVGLFIKVDEITLNRSKGKFARVCLNIDITKPLRGSLFLPIPIQLRPLEVPISYEGLHEVCAWCGSNAHDLDAYPETPKGPIEVIVEKFGAAKIQYDSKSCPMPISSPIPITEKWVTVSPKKPGRSFTFSRRKSTFKFATVPASPSVKIVSNSLTPDPDAAGCLQSGGSGVLPAETSIMAHLADYGPPMVLAAATVVDAAPAEPVVGTDAPSGTPLTAVSGPRAVDRLSPSSPHLCHSSPASPITGSALEDEDVDMFLNLEPDEEVQLSPESIKKRKFEVGEASFPSHSPN